MTKSKLLITSGIATALAASVASAEVTATQVWDDFEAYMTGFGYSVTATETDTGNGLTASDVTISMDVPDEDMTIALSMDALVLTDQGDGTVLMDFPASMPITIAEDDGADTKIVIDYASNDLAIVVSGEPNDLTYTYSAPSMSITLTEMIEDGMAVGRDKLNVSIIMEGLAGTSKTTVGNLRTVVQDMSLSSIRYNFNADEVEGPGSGKGAVSGSMSNVGFAGSTTIPNDMDTSDMAAALKAGFGVDGTMSYENGSFNLSGEEDGELFSAQGTSTTAEIAFAMSEDGLAYTTKGTGSTLQVMGGEIPFPILLEMGELAMNLAMPVSASQDEQDFAFGMTLGDFTMADMLWNIFDPGQILPRDPATLALDATGKAKLFLDLMDEDAMTDAGMSADVPGELNALTVSNVTLRLAGAELTGTGDFTFDNTDLDTFDGLPRPIGGVNLNVVGANALIDNLIKMGILAEEDAMGARMMMSVIGVPGDGEDTLKSNLQINEQGHILANGMRIQ